MELELNNSSKYCETHSCGAMQPSLYKLQLAVAKAYIFLLPVRMISPFIVTQKYFGACAAYFDLILHLLGLVLIVISRRGILKIGADKTSKLFQYVVIMFIWFGISSLIMSIVMQNTFGSIANQTAYRAAFFMIVYFSQYLFIILYNKEIFKMMTVNEISSIIGKTVISLLVLGYLQIAVMNFGGVFSKAYDTVDIFDVFRNSNKLPKLVLTGSEGASAGTLIGIFVLPYLLSKLLSGIKVLKHIIHIVLWLPVIYYTNSSTAYIVAAVDLVVFFMMFLLKKDKHPRLIISVSIVSIFTLFVVLFPSTVASVLPDEVGERIDYLLLEKATDTKNGSTVSRTIPLLVNWGAFTEYPILGVGNGNQGYFYEKYFPEWARHVAGSDVLVFLERTQNEIANGAVFFPSLLSGYGIVGMIFLICYLVMCFKIIKEKRKSLGIFYYMFFMSWAAVLFAGVQGSFEGTYYIWFILSIPFMAPDAPIPLHSSPSKLDHPKGG